MPLELEDDIAALAPHFDVGALGLHVPAIQQWFGVWAIEPVFGQQFAQRMQGFNLAKHAQQVQQTNIVVQGDQARAPDASLARSRSEIRVLSGGIALIDLAGSVMKYSSSFSNSTSTVNLRQLIRKADAADEVSQILLRVDSPGGTVSGVAEVFADLKAATKPTTVFVEDLAASAGYWIAAGADRIFANSMARVGSIGVFTVIADSSKAAEELGFKVHLVTTGEFKGAFSDGVPVTDSQVAYLQTLINQTFDVFLGAVAEGRGIPLAQVKALANGKVWSAQESVDLKLIDGVKTFDEVVAELRGGGVAKPTSNGARRGKTSAAAKEADPMAKDKDTTEPQAATLAELKAACAGAPADFVLAQLEASATTAQATAAWSAKQLADARAEADRLTKANAELTTKLDAAAKAPAGVKPVSEGAGDDVGGESTGDARAEWDAAIAAKMATGMPRATAAQQLAHEKPELRERIVAAANR